jgi:hypothetical protein
MVPIGRSAALAEIKQLSEEESPSSLPMITVLENMLSRYALLFDPPIPYPPPTPIPPPVP